MKIELVRTERALSQTNIDLADYVINPYKGCQAGCLYCYSRSNKGIRKIPDEWGGYVCVKENLPGLLEKELKQKKGIRRILIGSTTDPFQQVEEKYHITLQIMEILKSHEIPVVLLTKMNDIAGHLDLFTYSEKNIIYFTVNSEIVRQLFEKNSPCQKERLDVIESIYKRNIGLTAYIGPVFPYLTDIKSLFKDLKGRVKKVCLEGYNARLGNWEDIKKKLDPDRIKKYADIFFNEEIYNSYWLEFVNSTRQLNDQYGFDVRFFIYPFNSFYNNVTSK